MFGDVYYVAAPPSLKVKADPNVKSKGIVRMMANKSKRFSKDRPRRFRVAVSTTPLNRFAAEWTDANGFAAALGHRIGSKTGNPVGIIYMQTKMAKGKDGKSDNPVRIKSWIHPADLNMAPSLMPDYKDLGATRPGNEYYDANAMNYIKAWEKYWGEYVPAMIKTKSVPDEVPWGTYPTLNASVTSKASEVYNVYVHSFTPAALKGIIFIPSENMVADDAGKNFGPEVTALANSMKKRFGSNDIKFYAALPTKKLAPEITLPSSIKGSSSFIEIDKWNDPEEMMALIEQVAK